MSVTCRDIVRRALRKLSRVAAGQDVAGDDLVDGLETLQALYLEFVGLGVFGRMWDVVATADFTVLPQMRVLSNNESGIAVTLPQIIDPNAYSFYPQYGYPFFPWGCWADGYDYGFGWNTTLSPRPPWDGACVEINDAFSPTSQTWIYQSACANWIMLEKLNPSDVAPLAAKYSDGIASLLAQRISPEYGMQTPQEVASAASRCLYALTHRYDKPRRPVATEYF